MSVFLERVKTALILSGMQKPVQFCGAEEMVLYSALLWDLF